MQEKKEEDLRQRLNKLFEVGIDEVGKGAVFGPVFSAVVVLTEKNKIILKELGVIDSKKLTQKKENYFYQKFCRFLLIMVLGNHRSEKLKSLESELQQNFQ